MKYILLYREDQINTREAPGSGGFSTKTEIEREQRYNFYFL